MPLTPPSHDIDMATACYRSGMTCFKQAHFAEAIDFLKKATHLRPDMTDAWYCLGLAYKKQDQPDAAMTAFEAVLALSPDHHAARFHLASLLMLKQDTKAALPHFETIAAA